MLDGFYIGPIKIYFYGIIIMMGVLIAIWISLREARWHQQNSELIWDMVPWLLVGGLVGARLWHVLTPSQSLGIGVEYYLNNPLEILNTRKGGLGIPGAVIGGALSLWIFSIRNKMQFWLWTDIMAPGLALAQAIGRWGNFVNQELYGPPSNLPWAIYIEPAHRLPAYADYATFHPMFLYESLWNLFNFFLLLWVSRKYKQELDPGEIFILYLIIYPLGRSILEFIRVDSSLVGGININQLIMGLVALVSCIIFILKRNKKLQRKKI